MASVTPEDLMLKDYDETHRAKEVIESKSANYMVAVTLIMSIVVQFVTNLEKCKMSFELKLLSLLFYCIPFCLGVVLLFLFVFALKPRLLKFFKLSELISLYHDPKDDTEKLKDIIDTCESFAVANKKTIDELRTINKVIHICVLSLVISFLAACVFFFSQIILSMR